MVHSGQILRLGWKDNRNGKREEEEEHIMNTNSEKKWGKKIPNKNYRYIIIRKFIAYLFDERWNKNNSVQFQSEPNRPAKYINISYGSTRKNKNQKPNEIIILLIEYRQSTVVLQQSTINMDDGRYMVWLLLLFQIGIVFERPKRFNIRSNEFLRFHIKWGRKQESNNTWF